MVNEMAFDPEADLKGLQSVEEFLTFFEIAYDESIVNINRLHILQRFNRYVNAGNAPTTFNAWKDALLQAYQDFVIADARTNAVFKVFQRAQGISKIPLSSIRRKGQP